MVIRRHILTLALTLITLSGVAQFKLYEKGHDAYTAGKYQDAITNFSEYLTKPTRDKALDVEVFYLRALSYSSQTISKVPSTIFRKRSF